MAAGSTGWWGARVAAIALVAVAILLLWRTSQDIRETDGRPIFLEPGQYRGPEVPKLDQAQVEAVTERAQRLNF